MLIRFNVKNFLSFNEKLDIKTQEKRSQEFAMLSGSTRGKKNHIVEINDQNILKFAAIFGANAADNNDKLVARRSANSRNAAASSGTVLRSGDAPRRSARCSGEMMVSSDAA